MSEKSNFWHPRCYILEISLLFYLKFKKILLEHRVRSDRAESRVTTPYQEVFSPKIQDNP